MRVWPIPAAISAVSLRVLSKRQQKQSTRRKVIVTVWVCFVLLHDEKHRPFITRSVHSLFIFKLFKEKELLIKGTKNAVNIKK
jgi:hypothetical protein